MTRDLEKGLTEVLLFLTISCYSETPGRKEKIERMATSVSDAIEALKEMKKESA